MVFVDTSVWVDFFNGVNSQEVQLLDQILDQQQIVTGDLILVELLQGFRHTRDFNQAKKLLDSLEYRDMSNKNLAYQSAQNYRSLRQKGVTIRKTIDVMIATFCIENHFELLHSDRDFDPMVKYLGLKVLKSARH